MENTPSPSKAPIIILSIVTVIAIAGASTLGFLYVNEKNKPQTTQVNTVQENTDAAKEPQAITLLTEKEAQETYAQKSTDQKVEYSTDIGKFSLQLPSTLGIVQEIDGGGEGSIETSISIGKRTGGLTVVPFGPSFDIRAIQLRDDEAAGKTNDSNAYKKILTSYGVITEDDFTGGLEPVKEGKSKIGSLDAITYQVNGMFSVEHIVTKKNGMFYVISYDKDDETQQAILNIIADDLKIK